MSKVIEVTSYKPKSGDNLFFDNNIWMFLFCPLHNYEKNKQSKYSDLFKSVLSVNASIWINSLILSEFCNSWLRIEYNKWKLLPANKGCNDYKRHFISSTKYQETISEIKDIIPAILKNSQRGSDNFNAVNIETILSELNNCDFNDSYYLDLARINNWKIVTDDSDLITSKACKVDIITANVIK